MPIFNELNSVNEISNLDENQSLVGALPVSLRGSVITDADYKLDPCLPPLDSLSDARIVAKCARDLDIVARRCQDPIKRTMIKTAAASLWDTSVETYAHMFKSRGSK